MSRLIDADALIKRLEDLAADSWNKESGASLYLCDFADLVDDFPSAHHWIPCTERLPEPNEMHILTVEHGKGNRFIGVGFMEKDGRWGNYLGFELEATPIAWMPFPEIYQGEENECN